MALQLFFSGLIFLVAAALFLWERHMFMQYRDSDPWLYTASRFRRRLIICFVLTFISAGLMLDALGYLPESASFLLLFGIILLSATAVLLMLALQDLRETTRNARAQAQAELNRTLQAAMDKEQQERDNP